MQGINKQETGFKFGKNLVQVQNEIKRVKNNGREYRLLNVMADQKPYISLRLYNAKNHFIKQFMMEPVVARELGLVQ